MYGNGKITVFKIRGDVILPLQIITIRYNTVKFKIGVILNGDFCTGFR